MNINSFNFSYKIRKLIFNDLSDVKEDIIFTDKIGRIRDIQIHPNNGKIYFLGDFEKPKPGSEGAITSKASSFFPPNFSG